ncbi:hypothetical protein SLEP1_g12877 [Rubroshorea leprosula]|uniref:LOB domain-containing protein n=1 Tax=Rubroshorea leprosula TaxID=152421 RepID=A0AAV5IMQ3_9ROSI|nr:hypothetical protein SLEP1_g12877 [Rubroshorea leprosula]
MHQKTAKSSPACAACKYHRRKCEPNCPLAPYFPAHLHNDFLHAHRLFGVSNIVKMTANLQPHQKNIAMTSIIYQANVRAIDPVGGCYRIICDLQRQIDFAAAQLQMVRTQIAFSKTQLANQMNPADGANSAPQWITIDGYDDDFELYDAGLRALVPTVECQQQGVHHFQEPLREQEQKGVVPKAEQVYEVFDSRTVKAEADESPSFSSQLREKRGFADVTQIVGGFHEREVGSIPCR